MKIAMLLDAVNNRIDNAMQWSVMRQLALYTDSHEVVFIDVPALGANNAIARLMAQEYDILVTYNKSGTNLTTVGSGAPVLSQIKRPQICWLTEPIFNFYDLYKQTDSAFRRYILPNPSHGFLAKYCRLKGNLSYEAFGADKKERLGAESARPYDICVAAQWRGPAESNAFWLGKTGKARKFFEDAARFQFDLDSRDTFLAYITSASYHNLVIDDIDTHMAAIKAMYWYARKLERIKLIQDVVGTGLHVALIGGEEWKLVLRSYDNVTFYPHRDPSEVLRLYGQSKAVVGLNCYNGANERVFDAMSVGSMVIAENSPTLTTRFRHDEAAIYYEPLKFDSLEEKIRHLIISGEYKKVAMNGRQIFEEAHTWGHRSKFLQTCF